MARKILIIGISGGTHYNEILSGILMGYFAAMQVGEMTYVGQKRTMPAPFSEKNTTRLTLSDFAWERLPDYDAVITLGQTGSYGLTYDQSGMRHFTFPPSPDNMSDAQVDAVTEFVRSGKGCVAIHTACLRFNRKFNAMLGGGFVTHGPIHEFPVRVIDQGNPITQGVKPFQTVDELFFTEHDADVHVFLEAEENGKTSPQAWTKPYGKGKVVFIALGHDHRTFLNSEFLNVVERATRWVTGDL